MDRAGKEVRYVIDFYNGQEDLLSGKPVALHIDARYHGCMSLCTQYTLTYTAAVTARTVTNLGVQARPRFPRRIL